MEERKIPVNYNLVIHSPGLNQSESWSKELMVYCAPTEKTTLFIDHFQFKFESHEQSLRDATMEGCPFDTFIYVLNRNTTAEDYAVLLKHLRKDGWEKKP
jgi:hypothetical protein